MKKLLVVLCMLTLAVTACGKKEEAVDTPTTVDTSNNTVAPEESEDTNNSEETVNLAEYVGHYSSEEAEVNINKTGDSYSMEVAIYGLANMDEGQVSASDSGVFFNSIDPNGNPMTLSFISNDDETYTLKVEASSWELLDTGTVFEGLIKGSTEKSNSATSDLEDGTYYTSLSPQPADYAPAYATGFVLEADCIVVDASFNLMNDDGFDVLATLEKKPYTIAIDENTKFLSGGGDGEPQYMSATEFNDYIEQCMDSGLGLNIIIKNGVAVEIGIWS